MRLTVAGLNLFLGVAYCGIGLITAIEMRRDWPAFGFSHFGAAWIAIAFTCGPHHLIHGLHTVLAGRQGGSLDLLSVVVGLPVGVVWLFLRVEAFFGRRGDRFIVGKPSWLRAAPFVAGLYLAVLGGLSIFVAMRDGVRFQSSIIANLLLIGVYTTIGWMVLRTQLSNHPRIGGWSVSGLCLAAIFPTCALMHGVWALYALTGTYHQDVHGLVIDWLSIPAGAYFLWVVRRLYREPLRDWSEGPGGVSDMVVATVGH